MDSRRQTVEHITQEVHITALPSGLGVEYLDGPFQAEVVVADDKFHAA